MKNKFSLFMSLLCLTSFAFASGFKVDFFNVGQGHCTLVRFKEGPPLLVDAGSSALVGRTEREKQTFKKKQLEAIALEITEAKPTDKKKWKVDLNVIVSHGDEDHYNWITGLFNQLRGLRVRFLLGGKKEDYSKELQVLVEKARKHDVPSYIEEWDKKLSEIPPFELHSNARCTLLAAERTRDKNRNSIVVKVEDTSAGGGSVILAGDATGDTTDRILKTYAGDLSPLKTTILQASHHGADSDRSNSKEWIEAASPSYVVISAGMRKDYLHPRQQTLENVLASPSLKKDVQVHSLQYHSERPFADYHKMLESPKTVFRLANDYLLAITRDGIFNTTSQGNIKFDGTEVAFDIKPKKDGASIILQKDLILFLLKTPAVINQLIALNFPAMELSRIDFKLMRKSLQKASQFLSFDLSAVTLEAVDFMEEFEKFFGKLTKLREVVFVKGLLDPTKKQIKDLWDHRGFVLPA